MSNTDNKTIDIFSKKELNNSSLNELNNINFDAIKKQTYQIQGKPISANALISLDRRILNDFLENCCKSINSENTRLFLSIEQLQKANLDIVENAILPPKACIKSSFQNANKEINKVDSQSHSFNQRIQISPKGNLHKKRFLSNKKKHKKFTPIKKNKKLSNKNTQPKITNSHHQLKIQKQQPTSDIRTSISSNKQIKSKVLKFENAETKFCLKLNKLQEMDLDVVEAVIQPIKNKKQINKVKSTVKKTEEKEILSIPKAKTICLPQKIEEPKIENKIEEEVIEKEVLGAKEPIQEVENNSLTFTISENRKKRLELIDELNKKKFQKIALQILLAIIAIFNLSGLFF